MYLARKGLLDCAVIVYEDTGTVITEKGKLVQSIGVRLTGIIKTSPIAETIEHVEEENGTISDKLGAVIDQVEGARRTFELGFENVAVRVAGF